MYKQNLLSGFKKKMIIEKKVFRIGFVSFFYENSAIENQSGECCKGFSLYLLIKQ